MKIKPIVLCFLQLNFIICYCQSVELNNLNMQDALSCEADFVSSLINAEQNEIVTFSQTSNNANSFYWNFSPSPSLVYSSEENPQVSFNQIGATTVNLSTSSSDGCTDTVTNPGPNIVNPTQNIEDCWTIINNGIDIYNGQYTYSQFPGYHDPEIMGLTEVLDGFITCGHYNEQIFDSKYGVSFSGLQNKNGSYLTKHNKDGLLKWIVYTEKNISSDRDVMYSTVEDTNGDIYVSGHSKGVFYDNFGNTIDFSNNGTGGFIIKLDSKGKILWHIKSNHIYAKRLHLDDNNNLIVSGDISGISSEKVLFFNNVQTDVLTNFDNVNVNRFFLKIDSLGSLQWYTGIKTTGPNSEFLEDIGHDGNNNLYLTGYCSFSVDIYSANSITPIVIPFTGNSPKLFLIKFDDNGQIVWKTKSYVDNPSYGEGVIPRSIITDSAGNSYITGNNDNYNSNYNQIFENANGTLTSESISAFYIAKINTNGICEWIRGATNVLYGTGYKIIKSGDEIVAVGSVSNNSSSNPLAPVEFLSTDGNNLQMSFYPSDYFLTVYDAEGNLKRVITNGSNNPDSFSRQRISGFFKDDNDNYYLGRNIHFLLFGLETYQNFGHTIESANVNGIDGVITKFREECGIVTYNAINQNIPDLVVCDDTSVGSNSDGLIAFNLLQHEENIINAQSASDYQITYFTDVTLVNQISNPSIYENTNAIETIYVNVEFLTTQNNSLQTSYTIEVVQLPTVTPIVEIKQCDDDLDGFSAFNLTEEYAEISTNYLSETISFYESQLEAETKTNPITEPSVYTNQTINIDTIWARVENTNGCFAICQVNLNISSTQIPSTFFRDFYECDAVTNQQDGISVFDFSSVDSEIQDLFPIGQTLEISYYENLPDALGQMNAISDISNYSNATPNTQDIFIRVENPLNNDCLGLGHYITLHVLEVPLVTGPLIIEQCDVDNDGVELFETSSIENELSFGQTGTITFTYEDELGNALPSPLPNPFTVNQSILNVFVTMSYQDANVPNGICSVQTTVSFSIFNSISVNTVPDFVVCDDDNDGQFAFDTSTIENTILNGEIADITYRNESGTILSNPLPNPFLIGTQTITAAVTEPTNPLCFTDIEINFIVSIQPVANTVDNDFVCDDVSNDGEHVFNLLNYNSEVLNDQSTSIFNVSYHSTQIDAEDRNNSLPNSYLSIAAIETIFVRIENNNNTSCFDITSFQIGVKYLPIANQPEDITVCDDESNDGFEIFDLTNQNNSILNGLSETENTISYFLSQTDADQNLNPINTSFENSENPQTIFVRLENSNLENCYSTTFFNLMVNEQPILTMEDLWFFCKGETVEIIANSGYESYLWSTGATSSSITVSEAGAYSVIVSNVYGDLVCETTKEVTVAMSNIATITNIETSDWTQTENIITVYVEGVGDYEYSLDDIDYQDSNEFMNLNAINDYTIYVRDKNGCGVISDDVYLLYYPRFFTPNGDAFHETWQIYNGNKEPNNIIYIYDRYGKLLKKMKSNNRWDGTYNGNLMPTSDYWFVLHRQNGKTYRGHFTLRR